MLDNTTQRFSVPFIFTLFFDNRQFRKKNPNEGLIMLCVYDRAIQKRYYIGLGHFCTAEVFEALTGHFYKNRVGEGKDRISVDRKKLTRQQITRIKNENKVLKIKLDGVLEKAEALNDYNICQGIQMFKSEMNQTKGSSFKAIGESKKRTLTKYKSKQRIDTSIRSLLKYTDGDVPITQISINLLDGYIAQLKNEGRLKNTIAGYLTDIQSIFNHAIESNIISERFYPFGKGKIKIQRSANEKEVLKKEDWQKLIKYETLYEKRTKALEFFKLSYAMNGANTWDMCCFLKEHLTDDKIKFYREKTESTQKVAVKRIIHRTEFINYMIDKYSDPDSPFLFNLFDKKDRLGTDKTRRKGDNINRSFNEQLQSICKALEIPKVSMMWARHQKATAYNDSGLTVEEINTLWGHDDLKTTKVYIHSLPSKKLTDKQKELDNELL